MTSVKQFEANRRNSRKSTAPKTGAGKQASRCNAVRHGLTAETVIGTLEDTQASCARCSSRKSAWCRKFRRDVALGYELYTLLLKPVEAAWQPAKSSIVATKRGAGRTAAQSCAHRAGAERSRRSHCSPIIARSRGSRADVVPSASTIVTLRRLQRGSPRATS